MLRLLCRPFAHQRIVQEHGERASGSGAHLGHEREERGDVEVGYRRGGGWRWKHGARVQRCGTRLAASVKDQNPGVSQRLSLEVAHVASDERGDAGCNPEGAKITGRVSHLFERKGLLHETRGDTATFRLALDPKQAALSDDVHLYHFPVL